MQNLVLNSGQQASQTITALPAYSDDVSIWHHMSDALHQSLYRVLTLLIAVLPGILAFFVALVIFALAGVVVSWILRRCLTWAKFDLRVARKGGSDWAPSSSPTELAARVSFWVCVLLGLIIGVSAFDTSYATGTALPISLLPYLTHAVGAALLLRTFQVMSKVQSGFDVHNVLTMQMATSGSRFEKTAGVAQAAREVQRRLDAIPGVEATAMTCCLPMTGGIDLPFTIEGVPPTDGPYNGDVQWRNVSSEYFQVYRIPLLQGRTFTENDQANTDHVVVITQSMAKKSSKSAPKKAPKPAA